MIRFLKWLFSLFSSAPARPAAPPAKPPVPDTAKNDAVPRPDIKVVEPVIDRPKMPWYLTPATLSFLAFIREVEAGRGGYNADFRNDDNWVLRNYTLDEVIGLAKRQVQQGEPSSAIGGYQFLSKTLESLKASLNLSGNEQFTESFQDDLAIALMIRRGLLDAVRGTVSLETFCNNLAKEWASFPVVTAIKGARRQLSPGQSYYAGDGLNKALHKPDDVKRMVGNMLTELRRAMPAGV